MNETFKLPATAGEIGQHLIESGYDAGQVLRVLNRYNGSAYVGVKMSQTGYNTVVRILEGTEQS